MKAGIPVKLPSWGGYWYWDEEKKTIMMKCREIDSDTGKNVLDIRESQRVEYTIENILSDEWEVAEKWKTPVLGGEAMFDFGTAIKYMKRGIKVKRAGWNGKNQCIALALRQRTELSSTASMKLLGIWLLPLLGHLVFRWDGLRHRLICWRKTGCLHNDGGAS